MSEVLWLEPIGGLAGDMFLAAALDLGLDRAALERALATLGVPGFRLEVTRAEAGGMAGTHLDVVVEPQPCHHSHGRALSEILAIVAASGLSPRAKAGARAVFERIGAAEAKVHGVPVEEVHFHEVGAVDSIVDVCGAAIALDLLGWPRLLSPPPELGQGFTKTAHGRLPVPPPAVLELLRGVAVRPGGPPGEAVTPTGAALLATFAEIVHEAPAFTPRAIGVGVGTARWPDRPNVVRVTLGASTPPRSAELRSARTEAGSVHPELTSARTEAGSVRPELPSARTEAGSVHPELPSARTEAGSVRPERRPPPAEVEGPVYLLECNLDDCPGQWVARAIEAALEEGALDAWATPCTMKKGRPGLVLSALAPAALRHRVARRLAAETTTLGVRFRPVERLELERAHEPVETAYGTVRVKVGRLEGEVLTVHPEYDDCLAAAKAHGVPVKEVAAAAAAGWRAGAGRP